MPPDLHSGCQTCGRWVFTEADRSLDVLHNATSGRGQNGNYHMSAVKAATHGGPVCRLIGSWLKRLAVLNTSDGRIFGSSAQVSGTPTGLSCQFLCTSSAPGWIPMSTQGL